MCDVPYSWRYVVVVVLLRRKRLCYFFLLPLTLSSPFSNVHLPPFFLFLFSTVPLSSALFSSFFSPLLLLFPLLLFLSLLLSYCPSFTLPLFFLLLFLFSFPTPPLTYYPILTLAFLLPFFLSSTPHLLFLFFHFTSST